MPVAPTGSAPCAARPSRRHPRRSCPETPTARRWTARGQAVVASDASHDYRTFDEEVPLNTLRDGTCGAFRRIKDRANAPELIDPGPRSPGWKRVCRVAADLVER